MRIDVVTIFPEYLEPLRHALLGRAIERGILGIGVHDLRQWAHDVHKSVDDTPFGGGPGMVMKPQVWGNALDDVAMLTGPAVAGELLTSSSPHTRSGRRSGKTPMAIEADPTDAHAATEDTLPLLVVPSPAGRPFTQDMAQRWAGEERLVFACGRYEGIDQRVFTDAQQRYRVEEVSLGDYVLIGGEVATLVMVEAVVRLIPGVLGNQVSHAEDSFQDGLLEGPSYTKPRVWRDLEVPAILTSGDHGRIARWRRDQALHRTVSVRPDLIKTVDIDGGLDAVDKQFLAAIDPAIESVEKWADPAQRLSDSE